MFISILYMFRATPYSSSVKSVVSIERLLYVTLCKWPSVYLIINDLVYFIDWNIITLNGRSVIITFLFDWTSLMFMEFVFIISSLFILYSDDDIFGDLNIIRFIILVSDCHLHRVTYNRCCIGTIDSPDDEHGVARNMWRIGINI
jgi:hypothetical protein